MKRPAELDVIEIGVPTAPPAPSRRPRWGAAIALVGLAALVGALQFVPQAGDRDEGGTVTLPEPDRARTALPPHSTAQLVPGSVRWAEVQGLDRFESVAGPVEAFGGRLLVGNPAGVNAAASAMVSTDGTFWSQLGTLHGIGGEIQIVDLAWRGDTLLALGTFTETMPPSDLVPRRRFSAVWSSADGRRWDMTQLPDSGSGWAALRLLVLGDMAMVGGWRQAESRSLAYYQVLAPEYQEGIASGELELHDYGNTMHVLVSPGISVHSARWPTSGLSDLGAGYVAVRSPRPGFWEQVDLPAGIHQLGPGPDDTILALAGTANVFRTTDGVDWERFNDLRVGDAWQLEQADETVLALTGPSMTVWTAGGSGTVDLSPVLTGNVGWTSDISSTGMVLLAQNTPAIAPPAANAAVPVGEYFLSFSNGRLTVTDELQRVVAAWFLFEGNVPIQGDYDASNGSVIMKAPEDGTLFTFPIDALQRLGRWYPEALPRSTMYLSTTGERWIASEVPLDGYAELVGPAGRDWLVKVTLPDFTAGLQPWASSVTRYLLASP
jgi:hypothetical protein